MNTGFGVGATFFGVVFGISGQTRAMVLCLLAGIASILWGIWPTLRKLWRPARQNPEPLSLREKRPLVIAVAFPSRKGRSGGGRVRYPVHSGLESKYYFDKVQILARGRTLGTSARIEARFRAEGVDQTIRFNLAFEPDGSPTAHRPLGGSSL